MSTHQVSKPCAGEIVHRRGVRPARHLQVEGRLRRHRRAVHEQDGAALLARPARASPTGTAWHVALVGPVLLALDDGRCRLASFIAAPMISYRIALRKHAALRGVDLDRDRVADGENLRRMGLHPKRLAGVERRIIFADVAEERALADRCARAAAARSAGLARRMFSGRIATSTLSPVPSPSGSGTIELEVRRPPRSCRCRRSRRCTLPGTRFTSPMKSATMRLAGRA